MKRTRKVVRNWFGADRRIIHLDINDFDRATWTKEQHKPQVRKFSFMNLKQPRLAPKLDDHYIAAAIEDLCKNGTLVKLPEPQIGGGYSHVGCQPAEPKTQSIQHFGGSPSDARKREAEAEIDRRCIECHYWPIVEKCPRTRYSFQSIKEEEGNRTTYRTKIILNGEDGTCKRCWEYKEKYQLREGHLSSDQPTGEDSCMEPKGRHPDLSW